MKEPFESLYLQDLKTAIEDVENEPHHDIAVAKLGDRENNSGRAKKLCCFCCPFTLCHSPTPCRNAEISNCVCSVARDTPHMQRSDIRRYRYDRFT